MYIPSAFNETDRDRLHEVIERNSFAALISQAEDAPVASHLPLLLDRHIGPHGQLIGHMARANPQWRHAAGQTVLAIFTGPHAYISPAWYETANAVPTWNYVAVHVTGRLRRVEDRSRLREIVRRTVEFHEAPRPQPWSLDSAEPAFIENLLDSIVGFTIDIERIEGKWKLSQNHPPERRQRVIQALEAGETENAAAMAHLMGLTLEQRP